MEAFEAVWCQNQPAVVALENGDPPVLVIGREFARRVQVREQNFVLGRLMARVRDGQLVTHRLGPDGDVLHLLHVVGPADRGHFDPGEGPPAGAVAALMVDRAVVDPVDRPLPLAAAQAQQALPYPRAAIVDGRAAPGDAGAPRRAGRILPAAQGRQRRGAKPILLEAGPSRSRSF